MRQPQYFILIAISGLPALCVQSVAADDNIDFFERKIRPVLIEYCYECHSSESDDAAGGLLLDSRDGMHRGGETGPAVVPSNLSESLLLSAIEYRDLEMPPNEKLDEEIINDFRHWIKSGAADPRGEAMTKSVPQSEDISPLWSLRPVERPDVPAVRQGDWPNSDIDRFVLARLEAASLRPSGSASKRTLLRRVSFDLTGLPPTPEAVTAVEQSSDDAWYEAYVDKLLRSAHFGERWGRHWLDVVRYGESAGSSRDVLMLYSWRYRDYVINAFNTDMPYDEFVRQQIAGDLLPAESDQQRQQYVVATGLLAIGSKSLNGGNLTLDIADDQIDVVGKAVLGLTISCARCHDHKFDPIPTADYYALAGIFRNTRTFYGGSTNRPKDFKQQLAVYLPLTSVSPEVEQARAAIKKKIATIKQKQVANEKRLTALETRLPKDWKQLAKENPGANPPAAKVLQQIRQFEELQQQINQSKSDLKQLNSEQETLPIPEFAFGTQDVEKIRDWPIQIRGDSKNNGEVVPRGFLSCVDLPADDPIPTNESGRRQLADWITHTDHPLTSRVLVNRVWQHLFGRGLVESTNNFGTSGTLPTHPQLLDYLAHRFVHHHHWSVKSLVKDIVLSRTYQMSSAANDVGWEQDPANQLLWRANRRRLEAEAIRDAMLAVSGQLDHEPPKGSLVQQIGEGEVGRNIKTAPLEAPFPHRSVYLPIIRGLLPEILKVFDFPDPANPTGQRSITNVPTQSLFLLNSPFVLEQSQGFAARVLADADDDHRRLIFAWKICLGRQPDAEEISDAKRFLALLHTENSTDQDSVDPWQVLCQSLLSSAEFRFID